MKYFIDETIYMFVVSNGYDKFTNKASNGNVTKDINVANHQQKKEL